MVEDRGWSSYDLMKYGEMVGKLLAGPGEGFRTTVHVVDPFQGSPEARARIHVPGHGELEVILRPVPERR